MNGADLQVCPFTAEGSHGTVQYSTEPRCGVQRVLRDPPLDAPPQHIPEHRAQDELEDHRRSANPH